MEQIIIELHGWEKIIEVEFDVIRRGTVNVDIHPPLDHMIIDPGEPIIPTEYTCRQALFQYEGQIRRNRRVYTYNDQKGITWQKSFEK